MDNYLNCCRIPHFICSLLICVIFLSASIFIFFAGLIFPQYVINIYMISGTKLQIQITIGIVIPILIAGDICLAYGVAKNWALFLLIWILINIIVWNLHFILFVCCFSIAMINIEVCDNDCSYSLLFMFVICVFWLICVIQVAKHWYTLCEEIYIQEYGQRPGQVSHYRMLSISNRTRLNANSSTLSARIPDVLTRIER